MTKRIKEYILDFPKFPEITQLDYEKLGDAMYDNFRNPKGELEEEFTSIPVAYSGAIVNGAIIAGWIKSENGSLASCDDMSPGLVRELSISVGKLLLLLSKKELWLKEHKKMFSDLTESFPVITQKNLTKYEKLKRKRYGLARSMASLPGLSVRIAAELEWIGIEKVLVGKLHPCVVNALDSYIGETIRKSLEFDPN